MFDEKSRYKDQQQLDWTDGRGRQVKVVSVPLAPPQSLLGFHLLKQGQRADHLAAKYNGDPAGFWRICEANDVMLPDALTAKSEIAIPQK
ncbi:MAG: hypothetical protein AAFV95_10440 [Bacteroidota bacterium]